MDLERIVEMNPALYAPAGKKNSDQIGRARRVLTAMTEIDLTDNQGRLIDAPIPRADSSEYGEWKQSFQTLCSEVQDAVMSDLNNRYTAIENYLEERNPNLQQKDKKAFYTSIFQKTKFAKTGDPFLNGVANRLSAIGTLEKKLKGWVNENPAERSS